MSCSVSSSQGVLLTSLPSTDGKEGVSFSIISSGEKWIKLILTSTQFQLSILILSVNLG